MAKYKQDAMSADDVKREDLTLKVSLLEAAYLGTHLGEYLNKFVPHVKELVDKNGIPDEDSSDEYKDLLIKTEALVRMYKKLEKLVDEIVED